MSVRESGATLVAVVPAFGSASTLERTVRALRGADGARPARIVVVGTWAELVVLDPTANDNVVRLCCPRRLSAGRARNLGRSAARDASLLAFVDADCAVANDCLQLLCEASQSEDLAVVAASVRSASLGWVAFVRHALEFKDFDGPTPRARQTLVPSATMLVRAKDFDSVGGFPDLWPGEDFVFCARLDQAGRGIDRNSAAVTHHLHPCGLARALRHQLRLGFTSAQARRMAPLPGAVFVRQRVLVPLLFPARALRLLAWVWARSSREWLRAALSSPLLAAGLACWTVGFWQGAAADNVDGPS